MTNTMHLFQSLRPIQWIKNGFILIPLLFAQKAFNYPSLLLSLQAVGIFCALSSATYLINDLFDLEEDRKHPIKRHRPLAAGLISPGIAKITASVLLFLSLLWGVYMGPVFFLILIIYLTIQFLYNYFLKDVVILDMLCISSGFFLRVIAGAVVIEVVISHWLIICTILISMFLALGKRRHELVILGPEVSKNHWKILAEYNLNFLDQMIGITAACTLLSYMLYCISPQTIEKFQTDRLVYTFPFVLYGIFRYLYLIHRKNQGGAPEKLFVSDLPLLLSVILWGLFCMLIIYRVL